MEPSGIVGWGGTTVQINMRAQPQRDQGGTKDLFEASKVYRKCHERGVRRRHLLGGSIGPRQLAAKKRKGEGMGCGRYSCETKQNKIIRYKTKKGCSYRTIFVFADTVGERGGGGAIQSALCR